SKLNGDGRVSVSFFGDGATEEGHFHETLNLAAIYRLPAIFVCENNLYSSHLHISERRLADNIEQSGQLHGIPAFRLDGNDVTAVYDAARAAAEQARQGKGPTLLECRTYRWRGHVGPSWDMDVGLKRKDELKDWLARDPLARLRELLLHRGFTPASLDGLESECLAEVNDAVRFARESPLPAADGVLRHVF
ncbi:MAG: thiamine pyrophosphate-dependent enzyme, partial [Candidatus Binataceae bacterium]